MASYPAAVAIVLHAAEFTQFELQSALNRVMTSKLEDQPLLKDGVSINSGSPATNGSGLEIEYTNDGTLSSDEVAQRLQDLTGVPVSTTVGQPTTPLTATINRWNDVAYRCASNTRTF